jgi:hypothetical protein
MNQVEHHGHGKVTEISIALIVVCMVVGGVYFFSEIALYIRSTQHVLREGNIDSEMSIADKSEVMELVRSSSVEETRRKLDIVSSLHE